MTPTFAFDHAALNHTINPTTNGGNINKQSRDNGPWTLVPLMLAAVTEIDTEMSEVNAPTFIRLRLCNCFAQPTKLIVHSSIPTIDAHKTALKCKSIMLTPLIEA